MACKWLGLFRLSSFLCRSKLNILCYHGFSYEDEYQFRSSLFMKPTTLERRLAWLAKHGFKVLQLEEGVDRLYAGNLPAKSIVITIDDGFRSVVDLAASIFKNYQMPVTLYVTSYYVQKGNPIFRLAMQYMNWKTDKDRNCLLTLIDSFPQKEQEKVNWKEEPIWSLIDYGERYLTESQRISLAREVSELLDVDYGHIRDVGMMSLLSEVEIANLSERGIDVQLHTHRHTFPNTIDKAVQEIRDNRAVLEPLMGKNLKHFCYPSGIWSREHWPILEELGIRTATTCDPGLNDSSVPRFGLRRFLDREDTPQIEFEAELYGFKELLRKVRAIFIKED